MRVEVETATQRLTRARSRTRTPPTFSIGLGVGYDFHLGQSFGLVPQINLDLVNNEEVWVYGVAVSYAW